MAEKKTDFEGAPVSEKKAKPAKKKDAEASPASDKKEKAAGKAAKEAEVPVPEVIAAPKPQTKSTKIPKLASKNKSRLPRRQKKAQQKLARGK